ncbi:MAG: S16 family serine protease [Candidatus Izemoplasmatales bacterium]|jgi:PDZ domain-containing protein|nr:S16 family serine protease [Candidatus Izemoplasmatales bacterium]
MTELTKKFWPYIKILFIPYIFFLFILTYSIEYYITTPGGLTEVESLIEIEGYEEKSEGSFSTTFVVSINKPSFFQFMIAELSNFNNTGVLTGRSATLTPEERNQISYLDKVTSVDAAIVVAYQEASKTNPNIMIDYETKVMVFGKDLTMSYYDDINFGDEFLYVIGDNDFIVTSEDFIEDSGLIKDNTALEEAYEFYFKNEEGEVYSRILEKNPETGLFGISFKIYYLVIDDATFPKYTENPSNIGGPSGGLLQTLAIYNMLTEEDITGGLKIAGTGTIRLDGSVGYIGGVEQKIVTAYVNKVDLFLIPFLDATKSTDNYIQALAACEKHGIDPTGWLVPVSSFADALAYFDDPATYMEGIDIS